MAEKCCLTMTAGPSLLLNDDLKYATSLKNIFIKNPISSSACERDVTFFLTVTKICIESQLNTV